MTNDGSGGIKWIEYTSKYLRSFRKLSPALRQRAREREMIFRVNPFDSRLETHKLHGKFRQYWSYSVNEKYRVVFRFINGSKVLFFDVGDHAIYR